MSGNQAHQSLICLWIISLQGIHKIILIKRNQLELLQAQDESQHEGVLNQKITILIKTFRSVRHYFADIDNNPAVADIQEMSPKLCELI